MKPNCPLCNSSHCYFVETISISDLQYFYQKKYSVDVESEFNEIDNLFFYHCDECFLGFFWPMIEGSSKFYWNLSRNSWYYQQDKSEFRTISALIPQGSSVLDIGCGEGNFAWFLNNCSYTGLEKYIMSSNNQGLNIVSDTIEHHSIEYANNYDVVCAFQVLEHVNAIRQFIDSCLRCLKPGGLFVISVPSGESFYSETINGILNMPPHHISWWKDKTFHWIASAYDMALLSLKHEPLSKIHYKRYAHNKVVTRINRRFNRPFHLVDRSFKHKIIELFALPVSLVVYIGLIFNILPLPVGHTVTAVYKKTI